MFSAQRLDLGGVEPVDFLAIQSAIRKASQGRPLGQQQQRPAVLLQGMADGSNGGSASGLAREAENLARQI